MGYLQSIKERIEWAVKRLGNVINNLDNKLFGYTADDIIMPLQRLANKQAMILNSGVAQVHSLDNAAR